jgi:hypothetical protein
MRGGRIAAALLAFALCAPAAEKPNAPILPPESSSAVADSEIDRIQREITARMEELTSKLSRLGALQEAYSDERRVPEVLAERSALVAELRRKLELMDSLEMAYSNAFSTQDKVMKARTFGNISEGKGIPMEAVGALASSYGRIEFMEEARAFRRKAKVMLAAEEVSFGSAQDAYRSRTLLYRVAAATLALLGGAAALIFMRRRRGAALALLLLSWPAGAAWSTERKDDSLERLTGDISSLIEETTPLLQRLEIVGESCSEAGGFERCAAERESLRSGILARTQRLHALESACDVGRERGGWGALLAAVGAAKARKKIPAAAGADFMKSASLKSIGTQARDFRKQALEKLDNEAESFKTAEKIANSRRLLKRVAAGLGTLLLIPAAFLAWRRFLPQRRAPARVVSPDSLLRGAYHVDRELGEGRLGTVYEATEVERRAKVALRRCARARPCAVPAHPNIAAVLSTFKEDGQSYQVVEFVKGRPLSAHLENSRRLTMGAVKSVVRQAAAALEHAHAHGIVHGGLKPSKIHLTPEGVVKLRDFGLPLPDSIYSAPEVMEGGPAAPAADIFSLGAILYEMLAGRPPHEGDGLSQRKRMLFIPLSDLVLDIQPAADAIVKRALEGDPGRRFPSAAELAAAVEALPG